MLLLFFLGTAAAMTEVTLGQFGAVNNTNTLAAAETNAAALEKAFFAASPNVVIRVASDELYFFFHSSVSGVDNVTLVLDGEFVIYGNEDIAAWPNRNNDGGNFSCFYFVNCTDLTLTGTGRINGKGYNWWWYDGKDAKR